MHYDYLNQDFFLEYFYLFLGMKKRVTPMRERVKVPWGDYCCDIALYKENIWDFPPTAG